MMMIRGLHATLAAMTVMCIAVLPCAAQQVDDFAGDWAGTINAGGQKIRLIFHFTVADDGGLEGTMDVPAQGAFDIAIDSIALDGSRIEVELNLPGGASYSGALDSAGGQITGAFSQGGGTRPLTLARSDEQAGPSRPQEPVEPYPYGVERITFANYKAGIELSGTLTVPAGDGPFPGVVLVSGAGPHDRNASMMGHKPFLVLADHLTRHGIAVLRYDERGVGSSGGEFDEATPTDFASDARAAATRLRNDPRMDDRRVGVLGHSEGGLAALIAADESQRIAFVVMLASPAAPGLESILASTQATALIHGRPRPVIEANLRIFEAIGRIVIEEDDRRVAEERMRDAIEDELADLDPAVRSALGFSNAVTTQLIEQFNRPGTRFVLAFDPRPVLKRINVPVLALYGGRDPLSPHDLHASAARSALAESGDGHATVEVLDGLNHLFQEAGTGSPAEFGQIAQTMSPVAMDAISKWIMRSKE